MTRILVTGSTTGEEYSRSDSVSQSISGTVTIFNNSQLLTKCGNYLYLEAMSCVDNILNSLICFLLQATRGVHHLINSNILCHCAKTVETGNY